MNSTLYLDLLLIYTIKWRKDHYNTTTKNTNNAWEIEYSTCYLGSKKPYVSKLGMYFSYGTENMGHFQYFDVFKVKL